MLSRVAPFLLFIATGSIAADSATAAEQTDRERVAAMVSGNNALLAKYPALVKVDRVIRVDCAARIPGHGAGDAFCGCASAVTMGLWRSGIDPAMAPRLIAYLNNPTDSAALEFLRFQGPELYAPLCTAAANP